MATENCKPAARDLQAGEKRLRVGNPPSPISKLGDDELLLQVLIRVPDPRSACRCKRVCKRWNSLLSGPYFNRRFVAHHQSINEGDPSLLIPSDDHNSVILSFLPLPDDGLARVCFRVFDSFKDLVLCGFWATRASDPGMVRSLFLCNPFTKQWVALPLMPERSHDERSLMVARLVCEPRSNPELDLGDDQVFVHSEYRFRVVCIYTAPGMPTKLDMFCSESGEWTEGALVLNSREYIIDFDKVVSCNGRLFWYAWYPGPILGVDPFHLDRPPIRVDRPPGFKMRLSDIISVSQGVLHIVRLESNFDVRPLLTVWRQDDDHVSWRELYRVWLKEPSKSCNYNREKCYIVCLHPDDPEIVFLENHDSSGDELMNILYHDVRTGEEGVFADYSYRWTVFQPRISCWPTPIPNYEKLQGAYDGSYSCWARQTGRQATPPSLFLPQ